MPLTDQDYIMISKIVVIFFGLVVILILGVLSLQTSRVKNCCNSEADFYSCRGYFGNLNNMNKRNYNRICKSNLYNDY